MIVGEGDGARDVSIYEQHEAAASFAGSSIIFIPSRPRTKTTHNSTHTHTH